MGKLAFLLMTSPYSFQNSDTVIKLANAALKAGHEVTGIYLYTDGVYNNVNTIKPSDDRDRNIAELFKELAAKGVKVVACPICAEYRGTQNNDLLLEGTNFDGLGALSEFVEDSDRILIFTA
ncbi:MAG TPA: DsrE family protein [Candidatus Bathyarchaeia archaeon]|nr:DsrE family protein [Candidatus Bathyarchaeia archaeon]